MSPSKIVVYSKAWRGFDGRVFLTEEEWQTYRRRPPVRYAAKALSGRQKVCELCGRHDVGAKLQAAHRIPFLRGVIVYGLTPEWLDGPDNLVWACMRKCNNDVELNNEQISSFLHANNLNLPDYIQR